MPTSPDIRLCGVVFHFFGFPCDYLTKSHNVMPGISPQRVGGELSGESIIPRNGLCLFASIGVASVLILQKLVAQEVVDTFGTRNQNSDLE